MICKDHYAQCMQFIESSNTKVRNTPKLAQTLGQPQPFIAVFPQDCMGQLASFGPT
jgi:hypothetical protein